MLQRFVLIVTVAILGACSSKPVIERASLNFDKRLDVFTVASCSDQKLPQPIWTQILAQGPQMHVSMGDNVYASKKEDRPFSLAYEKQNQVPEYAAFRKQVPMLAMLDDHDFGANDGGVENEFKFEAQEALIANFPYLKNAIPRPESGSYHSIMQGPSNQMVHFIVLDTRWNRTELKKAMDPKNPLHKYDPQTDPQSTILGANQWDWLKAEMLKPSQVKVIVSSIQVLPTEHGFEKWANFPRERAKLLKLIGESPTRNVIIVSGDRHLGEISSLDFKVAGRPTMKIIELTASSINKPSSITNEPNRLRIGSLEPSENYGLIGIDWVSGTINLALKNSKNTTVAELTRPLVY